MSNPLGALRRLLLTPSLGEVTFARRGFPTAPDEAVRRLEAVPQSVVCGFEWGIDSGGLWEVERRLELVDPELRGFAYEGAVMAHTVRDAMVPWGPTRSRQLLLGPASPHIFLAYIGIGFAMARLPRPLWRGVVPVLGEAQYYPTMTWLAVDGYGFDRAYFDTRRWVDQQRVPAPYPWQGRADYFPRAFDQGLGRALWFIHGAQPAEVAAAVARFAPHRRADLWSGVGLAATFAGGGRPAELAPLRERAGEHGPHLAQGAVFAAKARHHSGFVPDHTERAVAAATGRTAAQAAALADASAVAPDTRADDPPYELWRQRIRSHFS